MNIVQNQGMKGRLTSRAALPILLLLAACSAPAGGLPSEATGSQPDSTPRPAPSDTQAPAAEPGATVAPETQPAPTTAGAVFDQPWAMATLTDVTTGEQFRIADLAASGKVVFVEPMAIWCSNCRAQQREAVAAMQQLEVDAVEWIGVDVESSETADALARYREQNAFPFRYAIADTTLARALADEFGDVVLSPPSVNVIVLGTDGRVTHLLGHHDAADLVTIAVEHGA